MEASVTHPSPLGVRGEDDEKRAFAEALHLIMRAFIRLDGERHRMLPGEVQDEFHSLAVEMTWRLNAVALNMTPYWPTDSPTPPEATLCDQDEEVPDIQRLYQHDLSGPVGEIKRSFLRRGLDEFLSFFGAGVSQGSAARRAMSALSNVFDMGESFLESAGLNALAEGCYAAKYVCDFAIRRFADPVIGPATPPHATAP